MGLKEALESMMSGTASQAGCDCLACRRELPKTLTEIQELLLKSLRELERMTPLAPIPGHLYLTPSGRKVLVCMKADEEKDYTLVDVNDGDRATIRWDGQPYYKDLGVLLSLGADKLWVLVKDLGEAVGKG